MKNLKEARKCPKKLLFYFILFIYLFFQCNYVWNSLQRIITVIYVISWELASFYGEGLILFSFASKA